MKTSDLKLNDKNPRYIKDYRFEKLCDSIRDFPKMMTLRPIIVDDSGVILGGNMRFRACMKLGMKEIPDAWVRKASELTEEERRRFIIADNVGFGDFDMEILANEWDAVELEDWGMELKDLEQEPENEKSGGENEKTENQCPNCGYKW